MPNERSLQQFFALLWKNWKIKYRSKGSVFFEIVFPLLIAGIAMYMQSKAKIVKDNPAVRFPQEWTFLFEDFQQVLFYTPVSPAMEQVLNVDEGNTFPAAKSYRTVAEATVAHDDSLQTHIKSPVVSFLLDDVNTVPKHLKFKVNIGSKYESDKVYGNTFDLTLYDIPRAVVGVTRIFINYWQKQNGSPMRKIDLVFNRMPKLPTEERDNTVGFLTSEYHLTFLPLFCFAAITLVEEREKKIKESMKLMGLSDLIYWMSWFVMNFIYGLYVSVVMLLVVCLDYSPVGKMIKSSCLLFFIFELLAVANTITAAFLMSTIIKRGRTIGILSVIFFFGVIIGTENFLKLNLARIFIYLIGVFVYGFGFRLTLIVIKDKEEAERPVYFSTMAINENDPHKTFLDGILIMIMNTMFNAFILWYLSNVFPGEFGTPKPCNFLFTRSYWIPTAVEEKELPDIPPQEEKYFETPSSDLKAGIQVRNLIKMFGKNVAVAGTNLDVYEGQITVLLGHNGAGKTTTINMITGFLPATSGTITVQGLDMRKNTDAARKSIGLCPQHDILFAKLTCKEHLIFSLKIHGMYNKETKAAIVDRLNALGLGGKMNSLASKLSGGQKRKLSLACAFSGDTKVIFLDEPSSGLDPAARQEMWAFLKTMREGRTILLTTHYMDEADVLGDRIAIMAEGTVKCCGTPMFLKRVYGAGYTLKIVKQPSCLTNDVTEQIIQLIPEAKYISETNSEIDYLLPENMTEMFPELLKVLEDDLEKLHITGFGLTATTMEDVFVKVGEGGIAEDLAEENKKDDQSSVFIEMTESGLKERPKSSAVDLTNESSTIPTEKIFKIFNESKCATKPAVFHQQLRGIFIKKFILFKRSLVSSAILILLPLLFVAFGLYSDHQESLLQIKPMTYSVDRLINLITPISTTNETPPKLVEAYKKQLPSSEFTELDRNDPDGYFLNWGNANGREKYDQMGFGVLFNETGDTVLYYNGRLEHGQGIALQLMLNAEVKAALGDDFSVELGLQYFSTASITGFSTSTLSAVIFAMVILPVVFIYGLIVERATGAKHLQTLSGVHPIAYWLGTFGFDFLLFIAIIILYVCLLAFNHQIFLDNDRWLVLVIGFLTFGIASFPYLYLIQNIFSSPTLAIVIILIVNLIIGVIFSSIITVVKGVGVPLKGLYFFLDLFFGYISPNYALSSILLLMAFSQGAEGFIKVMEAFSYEIPICYSKLLGQGALSWIFIMLIEFKVIRLIWYHVSCIQTLFCGEKFADVMLAKEDDDVINERERVRESSKEDLLIRDALLLIDLKKIYCGLCSTKTAVHPVSFGVQDKECLGLLGQNGAGKTTIFKMLTGDITLSAGEAYVGGYNIKSDIKKVQSMMSYCPQFDALHDSLTGRETLYLYGRLRGVREQYLNTITEMVIDFITLRPHEDKVTFAYSGGNKRKLSMGIAIIGDPHFIMLDEPTAGMDPISRRILWKCLHMIRSMERTLVLTSHSMEECEALCTKIAILKRGRLMCLGSTQHLKNKFAQGYTVILHAKQKEDGTILPLKPAVDFMISSIPGTTVFNAQPSYYHLQVPETARLSEIFRLSLEAKSTLDLQHFTVQQTSLEQVFLLLMKN